MAKEPTADTEALVAELSWTRRIAFALLRSDPRAEDAAQEALEAALRHPPDTDRPVRPWLATIVRNRAFSLYRRDGRRQRYEAAAAAIEETTAPSAEESLERLQVHRLVAELLAELDEPFRQTLILRHFEDLSSPEIAKRLGVPEGTVRWRVKVGLERLRAALHARCGQDEEEVDRRLRLLLPPGALMPADDAGPPLSRRPRSHLTTALGGVCLVGLMSGAFVLLSRDRQTTLPPLGEAPTMSAPTSVAVALEERRSGRAGNGATLDEEVSGARCGDELARVRAELTRLEEFLGGYLDPVSAQSLGDPNPEGAVWVRRRIEAGLPPAGLEATVEVECRTYACRVALIGSDLPAPEHLPEALGAALPPGRHHAGHRRIFRDPVARADLVSTSILLRPDPVGAAAPLFRPRPTAPPAHLEGCLRALSEVRSRLEAATAKRRAVGAAEPLVVKFARGALDARLTADVRSALPADLLAAAPLECRDALCLLRTADAALAARIYKQVVESPFFKRRALWRTANADGVFIAMGSKDRVDGDEVLRALVTSFRASPAFSLCHERAPGSGRLVLGLALVPTGGSPRPEDGPPGSIELDTAGDLSELPLGRCLVQELRAQIETTVVPQEVSRGALTEELVLSR